MKITHVAEIVNITHVARILEAEICGAENVCAILLYNRRSLGFRAQEACISCISGLQNGPDYF